MSSAPHRITLPPWARPSSPRVIEKPAWISKGSPAPPAPPAPSRPLSLVPPSASPSSQPRMQSEAPGSRPSARPRSLPPRLSLVPPPPDPRIAELEATVATLSDELVAQRMRILEESEAQLVALALEIAERLVGRELAADPSIVGAWAKEALRKLGDRHALVVAVSPDLEGVVEGAIIDGSLPRSSCEIRDGARTIELGQDARIRAMADVLEVNPPGVDGSES